MKLLFCGPACFHSVRYGGKKTYEYNFVFVLNAHAPQISAGVPTNTFVPAGIVFVHAFVLVVLPIRHRP